MPRDPSPLGVYRVERVTFVRDKMFWVVVDHGGGPVDVCGLCSKDDAHAIAAALNRGAAISPSDPWVCGACGGTNVQHAVWMHSTSRVPLEDFGTFGAPESTWCDDCEASDGGLCRRSAYRPK